MPGGLESILGQVGGVAGGPVGMAANAGMQAIMGVAQLIRSGQQNREARKMQSKLVTPRLSVAQPLIDNQALAESRASQGITDQGMAVYENNMDRQLTTSIDAILRGGGNVNSIADLYDTAEDRFSNLVALDEEIRMKNTAMYLDQNEKMADELDKVWMVNEYAPYQDQRQAIAALRKQAEENKWKGLNTMTSGIGNYTQANMMQGETAAVFGQQQPAAPPMRQPVYGLETIGSSVPGANPYLQTLQNRPIGYTQYIQKIIGR